MSRLAFALVLLVVFTGCDSHLSQEEFEASTDPLELSVDVLNPQGLARDTLRLSVTGVNTTDSLYVPEVLLDGERVAHSRRRVNARTWHVGIYVSHLDGPHSATVQALDGVSTVAGRDTLRVQREATATVTARVQQTLWQRLVTGTSAYESNAQDVFTDARGDLWVRLSDYRSSFWSSPDGTDFRQRRSGFERFIGSERDTAWIEYNTAGSGGQSFLARVDLATGQNVDAYQVIYNGTLAAGDSHQGAFMGIYQGNQNLVHLRDGIVTFVEEGPYAFAADLGDLADFLITRDGTHWLATYRSGVFWNRGSGWERAEGPGAEQAIDLEEGPGGEVWVMNRSAAGCTVHAWEGGLWRERASFAQDGNGSCGVFAVGASGGVWRGRTDGYAERHKSGVLDRRYNTDAVEDIVVSGETVWMGTGYGVYQIRDYEE